MLNQIRPEDHPEHNFVWTDTEIDWIHNRDAKWQEFVNQSKMPERLVHLEAALNNANSHAIYKGRNATEWAKIASAQEAYIARLQIFTGKLQEAWDSERQAELSLAELKELI